MSWGEIERRAIAEMTEPMVGQVIGIVRVDWGFHLWFGEHYALLSGVVVVTTISSSGVEQVEIDCDVEPREAEPPLSDLVGLSIRQVTVADNGDLTIQLDDYQVRSRAHDWYESWQLGGPGGSMIICLPGGGLSVYSAWS